MAEISLSPLKRALTTLKDGFKIDPSDLERDGIIQRFEFSFELCWKSAKRVLFENGIEVDSPKAIFREIANMGWVDSAEPWLHYLSCRNKISHIYNQEIAQEVFSAIPDFIENADKLYKVLSEKVK